DVLRVARELPRRVLDRDVRRLRLVRPVGRAGGDAAVEVGRAGEGAVVDLQLEVALVLEPVPDVDRECHEHHRRAHEDGDDHEDASPLAPDLVERVPHAALGQVPPVLSVVKYFVGRTSSLIADFPAIVVCGPRPPHCAEVRKGIQSYRYDTITSTVSPTAGLLVEVPSLAL